jgi:hypothetical protein
MPFHLAETGRKSTRIFAQTVGHARILVQPGRLREDNRSLVNNTFKSTEVKN